jgi:hypothetical protein
MTKVYDKNNYYSQQCFVSIVVGKKIALLTF